MSKQVEQIIKGGIYYCTHINTGNHVQLGERPVVVIQNNIGNKHSPTIIVADITSKLKRRDLPTHYLIPPGSYLKKESMVLFESIYTVDKSELGKRFLLGTIPEEIIDQYLITTFGIKSFINL